MHRITGTERHYEWGSPTLIPEFLGNEPTGVPVAEFWLGAHPAAPSFVVGGESEGQGDEAADSPAGPPAEARTLTEYIASDPVAVLGEDVANRFDGVLPFLLKLIAPVHPLSLQVHPDIERAAARFAEENARGIPLDSPERNYRDPNHKPEMLYALTTFQAMAGFRAPRRAAELVRGLGTPLTERLRRILRAKPDAEGVAEAFATLLQEETRPTAQEVGEVAAACARRLAAGSPSPRVDRTVVALQADHPGDPGVVASLLLNPVTLQPGETLFVPAGSVHAYLSGLGIEVMASSDNVLRAGLTAKPIDVPEMLACVDYVAAPPIRIAPERISGATEVYYAPVDDFELGITRVTEPDGEIELPGRGPRVILGVEGTVTVTSGAVSETLTRGEAVFVRADSPQPRVSGEGMVAQADVP